MSVTRTFTVTVVSTGSGNKYFIDGVQQDTVNLAEGFTYKFDQSDSSNAAHPLRFSTTSNGTHSGGSEYTTGVTTNGVPGNSGAYTQIQVAASAPTLYYYCSNHSGMGGQANTVDADTWGMLPWNQNSWGKQDGTDISVSGFGLTSSVGDGTNMAVPSKGWGGETYGRGEWGQVNDNSAVLTGFGLTTSLNADGLLSFQSNGWGRNTWNSEPWGESSNPVVSLTGFGLTSSVGDGTNMGVPQQGWSGKSWGDNNWGELANIDVFPSGISATTSVGTVSITAEINTGWGRAAWNDDAWGIQGDILLDGQSATASVGSISPADVMGVTGIAATSSNTRAINAGGNEPGYLTDIEFFTIATTGNGTDFGDLTDAR